MNKKSREHFFVLVCYIHDLKMNGDIKNNKEKPTPQPKNTTIYFTCF